MRLAGLAAICVPVIAATLAAYALAANRARALFRSARAMRIAHRAAGGVMAGVAVAHGDEVSAMSDLLAIGEPLVELNQAQRRRAFRARVRRRHVERDDRRRSPRRATPPISPPSAPTGSGRR